MYSKIDYDQIIEKLQHYALSNEAKALFQKRKPSHHVNIVERWLDETSEAVYLLNNNAHVPFLSLNQIKPLLRKVDKGYILQPNELVACADFLRGVTQLRAYFARYQEQVPLLFAYSQYLIEDEVMVSQIMSAVSPTEVLSNADRELRKCRNQIRDKQKAIRAALDKFMKNTTNRAYIQDMMIVEKDGRPTIPIKSSYKNKVSGRPIVESDKGITTYIEPFTVGRLVDEKQELEVQEQEIVYRILCQLTNLVYSALDDYEKNAEAMIEFDFIFARAKYSRTYDGVRVNVNKENRLVLDQVKHPLIADARPLSLILEQGQTGLVITGINAGGKTVVLKTVGLLTLMTMYGLLIPSGPHTNIAIMDHLFISIGDNQSIDNSLSTFSSEMANLSDIIKKTSRYSLILFDELGSGTDPKEGTSLSIAALHHLYQTGALILATTHFSEIKDYALSNPYFLTASMGFDETKLLPTYQLLMGTVGESRAFLIAKKMGISSKIMTMATTILKEGIPSTFSSPPNLSSSHDKVKKASVIYEKGDRVRVKGAKEEALFFEYTPMKNEVVIFYDHTKNFDTVPVSNLQLVRQAKDLYPSGYNLDYLFIQDYQNYKFQKDLQRGSKKAWKKYRNNKEKYDSY